LLSIDIPDVPLDIERVLSDKRCSCDGGSRLCA
jgi:hypothetical protein